MLAVGAILTALTLPARAQTLTRSVDPSIGYGYGDKQIKGFSLTHVSGVGCNDCGDVFLTATTGPLGTKIADCASPFSHKTETASPGYYKVTLDQWGIDAELTAQLYPAAP